jgi:hypothetical protein
MSGLRGSLLVGIAIVGAAVLVYCLSFPAVSYRYRLSITIRVDGNPYSGSSVIEVWRQFAPGWFQAFVHGSGESVEVRGQAVFIDLGNRGALIAALADTYNHCVVAADDLVGRAFEPAEQRHRCVPGYSASYAYERSLPEKRGSINLTPDNLPAFLWFPDKTDLASVREIEHSQFSSVIGGMAELVSAQIEITSDPLVFDVDKKLPAYVKLTEPPVGRNFYTSPAGLRLICYQFLMQGVP